MYSNNRDAYRQAFFMAWQKYQKKLPLTALEARLLDVMLAHPEYHHFLENQKAFEKQEFVLEENPFLHMSLHLSIREQIATDRPQGIALVYQQLLEKYADALTVEHYMMTCLTETIWQAQQTGEMPDEKKYIDCLKKL